MDPEGATIPLNIWNTGKNVLTGVDLFFEHFPPDVKGPVRGTASLTTIGTLSPGWPKPLPITPAQRSKPTEPSTIGFKYILENGFYEETLQLRRSTKQGRRSSLPGPSNISL